MELRIEQDTDATSPRDWDNTGIMVCWHSRYNLGDEQPNGDASTYRMNLALEACPRLGDIYDQWYDVGYNRLYDKYECHQTTQQVIEDHIESLVEAVLEKHYVILPLYLYDHSGITMNTSGFSCGWDSGQVGFIYAPLEDDDDIEQVESNLRSEVQTYDQFLTGDVWGYVIEDEDGEHVDSCWGFFGYDYCEQEGKVALEYTGKMVA